MAADIEALVIGAGAIGLASARALALAGREVMVLERHDRIGAETSSRNSEVIHAGIYYPPGSLRARLCVSGKELLYRFCRDHGVTAWRCGKLLVAGEPGEEPRLKAIMENARLNGVTDLEPLDAAAARALEPELQCTAACLSPSTGVLDSHGYLQALQGNLEALGGQVVLQTDVRGVTRRKDGLFAAKVGSGAAAMTLTARNLVTAAGLGANALVRDLSEDYRPPRCYPAKGHWFQLQGKSPFRHLIYPMPQGAWLGLHLTLDSTGRARFGPDCEWRDEVSYDFEDADGRRLAAFESEIRRYWPGLPAGALAPDSTGVRPKLYPEGAPVADFSIEGAADHGLPGFVGLYGIESPGLTASLAIGAEVARLLTC